VKKNVKKMLNRRESCVAFPVLLVAFEKVEWMHIVLERSTSCGVFVAHK